MKWQYQISQDEAMLPRLGQEGWELIAVVPSGQHIKFYFKKPSLTLAEQITEEQREEVYRQLRKGEENS